VEFPNEQFVKSFRLRWATNGRVKSVKDVSDQAT